jgi:hypothetical protein
MESWEYVAYHVQYIKYRCTLALETLKQRLLNIIFNIYQPNSFLISVETLI